MRNRSTNLMNVTKRTICNISILAMQCGSILLSDDYAIFPTLSAFWPDSEYKKNHATSLTNSAFGLNFHFSELVREMEEFEARTTQNHQVHKQLLSGKLAAIEEMAHKQRLEHEDSDPKASSQSLQVEKRDGETD